MKKTTILAIHIVYWIVFLLIVFYFLFIVSSITNTGKELNVPTLFTRLVVIIIPFCLFPAVTAFYTAYGFLFSKFLKAKKIGRLFLVSIGISLIIGIVCIFLTQLVTVFEYEGNTWLWEEYIIVMALVLIWSSLNSAIGIVMRGFISWYNEFKMREALNQKNHEMELALIKSQINPHFLFNTLNNIDVLIELDAERASAYLKKLSDIMRFMLYETKSEQIPLEKELLYIEKYLDLQKIRSSNPNYVDVKVTGRAEGKFIEPMLLIPFIENAFKHVIPKQGETAIFIRIEIYADSLAFECRNHYSPNAEPETDYSGLGNDLIEKRLQLLYPKTHTLTKSKTADNYVVMLTLNFTER